MLAEANEKVRFALNWVAQAEYGGYYQAYADGTYAECGLDVEIIPGGPNVNSRALLMAGRLDFTLDGNLLQFFNSVQQDIPSKMIASFFQREPQILLTHPDQGLVTWENLKSAPVLFIANGGYYSYFQWMKSIGFNEQQRRPYNFNSAPFLANPRSGQQGYISSEPLLIEEIAGFKPNVFLLADYGFSSYASILITMNSTLQNKPDMVRCFVNASIIGWNRFLYGYPSVAVTLIQNDNPNLSLKNIHFAIKQMKKHGIVDSGDSLALGIGAITEKRIADFYQTMLDAKVVEPGLRYQKAYSLDYVNQGIGIALKKQLTGL